KPRSCQPQAQHGHAIFPDRRRHACVTWSEAMNMDAAAAPAAKLRPAQCSPARENRPTCLLLRTAAQANGNAKEGRARQRAGEPRANSTADGPKPECQAQ